MSSRPQSTARHRGIETHTGDGPLMAQRRAKSPACAAPHLGVAITLSDLREHILADPGAMTANAQVVLRWHIEHGIAVIPKSAQRAGIAANFDLFGFSLDTAEIARVDAMSRSRSRR